MAAGRFARANHVLVPAASGARDRYRRRPLGRLIVLLLAGLQRFSDEGRPFFAIALVAAPFTLDVRRSQLSVAWGALGGLLLASFIASFFYRLSSVRLRSTITRRVARGSPTRLGLVVENESTKPVHSLRVRGPFLPWDGQWQQRAAALAVLEPGARARVELEATFWFRGEHQLDPFRVQALVPLGLAMGPPVFSEAPHFLVVPRVAHVRTITLPKTRRQHSGGVPRAVHTADSRELAGVRPYRPGDAVRDLHMKTWARTGVPHVREYQEEYFSHLAVVVDGAAIDGRQAARPKSRFARRLYGEDEDARLEAALSVAAGVVAKVLTGESLVDLFVAGDARSSTALGRGRGTLEGALDRLAGVSRGGELDVELEVSRLVAERDRLSGVVVVCSAWTPRRAELVRRLETEGLAPLVVVCSDEAEQGGAPPNARVVSAKAVLAGDEVAL